MKILYRQLKKVWAHDHMDYILKFRKIFPELNQLSNKEMCDRWKSLNIDFYNERLKPVNPLLRLTLPFAILVLLLMFMGLPIVFLITGNWF